MSSYRMINSIGSALLPLSHSVGVLGGVVAVCGQGGYHISWVIIIV